MIENTETITIRIPLAPGRVWATWLLLGVTLLIYLATVALGLFLSSRLTVSFDAGYNLALYFLGWKENDLIAQGKYWRLLSPVFLHGGLAHIALNGMGIYVLGPQTERLYGTARFLTIYLVSGVAGSIASYAFNPAPAVGASGAIFGLVGALGVFFFTTRDIFGEAGRNQLQSMIALIVINVLFGFGSGGTIDNFGHLGGLAGGLACGWILVPRYELDRRFWPPVVMRHTPAIRWAGIVALVLVLVVLVRIIHPSA